MHRAKFWLTFVCLYFGFITSILADQFDGYIQASQQFDEWVEKTGAMPRLTDERAAALLATLSDNRRFLDGITFDDAQLPALMDVCDKANRKVMSYMLFDLRNHVDKSMSAETLQQAVLRLEQQNVLTYQDELSELQPFEIRCMARQTPLLARFIERLKPEEITPVRLRGLEQARKGIDGFFLGTLFSANDISLSERYRASMLKALAETASQFVPIMKQDEREKLELMAKAASNSAPESLKGYIETIAKNLAQSTCEGLCRY